MEDTLRDFRKRQQNLRRKHERMARGYVTGIDQNGLIVQTPDSKTGGRVLRLLVMLVAGFIGFKILLLAGLGPEQYSLHVTQLKSGSTGEQVGAWFMQIDPLSALLAGYLSPLLT
ncbi:hypothetical protein [Thetidibacter halocola]|uniref:Uncharacterized protein n=1 Tax=Thetidibacter halocola TaxID=2827239 RepID=A0A8J7WDF1_9RHOB|nr:hypothetical protein [Thetidibacter halocola]MBS0125560.1 hypothetical protein [Thetidibacter halocola]